MAEKQAPDGGTVPEEIRRLSFEQAMAELESIVKKLESGQVGLEDSIEMYSRGSALKQHCEAKLRAARQRVEKIVIGASGEASGIEPADVE